MRPTACKYCGRGVRANGKIIAFLCFTSVVDDCWSQSPECRLKGVENRLSRALAVLKSVERYDTDEVDPDTWRGDQVAQAVDASCVDQVIQILEGET